MHVRTNATRSRRRVFTGIASCEDQQDQDAQSGKMLYDEKLARCKWYPRHYRCLLHRAMISAYLQEVQLSSDPQREGLIPPVARLNTFPTFRLKRSSRYRILPVWYSNVVLQRKGISNASLELGPTTLPWQHRRALSITTERGKLI